MQIKQQLNFNPIMITIESKEELDTLLLCLKIGRFEFNRLYKYNSHIIKNSSYETSMELHDKLAMFYYNTKIVRTLDSEQQTI